MLALAVTVIEECPSCRCTQSMRAPFSKAMRANDRYGRWERSAEKLEAEKLEGAFPLGARTDARTGLAP